MGEQEPNDQEKKPENAHEQLSSGSSSNTEQRANECILRAFNTERKTEGFDAFDPSGYLELYYSALLPEVAVQLKDLIKKIETREGIKTMISLQDLGQLLISEKKEQNFETLENYLIYDFMIRKVVPRILQDIPEDHLRILDVGGGPSIYQHIPLFGIADTIRHGEFLSQNREVVKKWKSGEKGHEWQTFFQCWKISQRQSLAEMGGDPEIKARIEQMLGMEDTALEDMLRASLTEVMSIDVFRTDLGIEEQESTQDLSHVSREGSVELLTSNFCIESATADIATWQNGIKNISAQVLPGKFLSMTAIRNAEWYKVGETRMDAVSIDADRLALELMSQNFEILELTELIGTQEQKEKDGYDGMIFVLAKKKEAPK